MKYATLRMILAIVAQNQLYFLQLDVRSVFLNGVLQEELYVEQPEGFIEIEEEKMGLQVCKELYGLR